MSFGENWKDPPRTDRFHDFWYKATPKIFDWLGWLGILAAVEVVYRKNPEWPVLALLILGYLSLIFYFGAFFLRHPITIPGVRNRQVQWLLSNILAIALTYIVNRIAQYAVSAFVIGAP